MRGLLAVLALLLVASRALAAPCDTPTVIPAQGGTFTGTTSGTSSLAGSCGSSGTSPEVVFQWTPTVSGTATIQTCGAGTSFDTVLYLRSGTCASGAEVPSGCNDDACANSTGLFRASSIAPTVTAGQTYFIVVDGYGGAQGMFSLTVTPPGTCNTPIVIPAQGGTFSGTTSGTSSLAGSCGSSGTSPELVFQWTPAVSGTATIQTCGAGTTFDSVLYMRSGPCASGAEVPSGCNDDACANSTGLFRASSIAPTVTAGQTYFIVVDGYGGAQGTFSLTVTPPAAATTTTTTLTATSTTTTTLAGACSNPTVIPAQGGTFNGTTSGTSSLAGSCGSSGTSPEQVFQWTPAVSGTATIQTCGAGTTFDSVLYMRSGPCASGAEVAAGCNDDACPNASGLNRASSITTTVTAGQTYFIVVDGYGGAQGTFSLTVAAPTASTTTTTQPTTTGISYMYDPDGRLVAVVDPSQDSSGGGTAIYKYDAAGNIIGITRQATSTLQVISFRPPCGPWNSTLTIYGTGFSPTASNNLVTFGNGMGATAVPTSATATQLVVTVPGGSGGATSGTITATVGTATSPHSSQSFTVGCGGGPPTITDVTTCPGTSCATAHIGAQANETYSPPTPATPVTILGANFDATPANNRIVFNNTVAVAGSTGTPSSLSTTVPYHVGSGRVFVTTALGTASSSPVDFYVAPYSPDRLRYYTVSEIDPNALGRIAALPGMLTIGNIASGKVGLVLFDATAGQQVSIQSSNVSVPQGSLFVDDPTGDRVLGSSAGIYAGFTEVGTTWPIPLTGTYTIAVAPDPTYSGGLTLNIALSNATLTVRPSSFPAGGAISASWSGIAFPATYDRVGLFQSTDSDDTPTGSVFAETGATANGSATWGDSVLSIPHAGTWELRLFSDGGTKIAVSPFNVTCTGVILSVTTPGNTGSVQRGGSVTASWTGMTAPNCAPTVNDWIALIDPNPSQISRQSTGQTSANGTLQIPIPATATPGQYALWLYANNTHTRLATSYAFLVTQ